MLNPGGMNSFLICDLDKTMVSRHFRSPERFPNVLLSASPFGALASGLCQERMTTPLFTLTLPRCDRCADMFSQYVIDYYYKAGNTKLRRLETVLLLSRPPCPA